MATLNELKDEIARLTKQIGETSPVTTKKVKYQTGRERVGNSARSQNYKPVYTEIDQAVANPEYQKISEQLADARNRYTEEYVNREGTYNTLAEQIRGLTGDGRMPTGSLTWQPLTSLKTK